MTGSLRSFRRSWRACKRTLSRASRRRPSPSPRYLATWIQRHELEGTTEALASIVQKNMENYRAGELFGTLVRFAPERAASLFLAEETRTRSRATLSMSLRTGQIPLERSTRFLESVLSSGTLTESERFRLYISAMPGRLDKSGAPLAKRIADGQRFLALLERQLTREKTDHVRRDLERRIKNFRKQLTDAQR